jgi:Uma2 family endonuclease
VTSDERNVNRQLSSSVKFTYDDFLAFPDDGKRHEIIDGEHFVTPSPNTKHQAVVGNLHALLWTHLKQHPIGSVFVAPFDVLFSDTDVVEPDILYISRERLEILTDQHVRGAPDLVVEVLSPSARRTDEVIKRKLYDRAGVQEYWVVDPELETIKVYGRDKRQAFIKVTELAAEHREVLTTTLLSGWSALLTEIFASPR